MAYCHLWFSFNIILHIEINRRLQVAGVSSLRRVMEKIGWLKGSVLLVEKVNNPGNRKKLYGVHDGNTRHTAVMDVDAIKKVPCLIIELPAGVFSMVMCMFFGILKYARQIFDSVKSIKFTYFKFRTLIYLQKYFLYRCFLHK